MKYADFTKPKMEKKVRKLLYISLAGLTLPLPLLFFIAKRGESNEDKSFLYNFLWIIASVSAGYFTLHTKSTLRKGLVIFCHVVPILFSVISKNEFGEIDRTLFLGSWVLLLISILIGLLITDRSLESMDAN